MKGHWSQGDHGLLNSPRVIKGYWFSSQSAVRSTYINHVSPTQLAIDNVRSLLFQNIIPRWPNHSQSAINTISTIGAMAQSASEDPRSQFHGLSPTVSRSPLMTWHVLKIGPKWRIERKTPKWFIQLLWSLRPTKHHHPAKDLKMLGLSPQYKTQDLRMVWQGTKYSASLSTLRTWYSN